MLSFYVLHFTFDRGLCFWSGLLVLKFTVAVGVFTWADFSADHAVSRSSFHNAAVLIFACRNCYVFRL